MHTAPVRDVRFAAGDKQFLTVLDNIMKNVPTIFVWDLELDNLDNHPDCPKQTILGHVSKIGRALWGPLNKRIFSASDDATLRVWDPESGKQARSTPPRRAFTPRRVHSHRAAVRGQVRHVEHRKLNPLIAS